MKKTRREDIATVPSYIHLLESKFFLLQNTFELVYSVFHKLSNKEILVGDLYGHIHKYEAVFGSFVDIGIVVTFLSFT